MIVKNRTLVVMMGAVIFISGLSAQETINAERFLHGSGHFPDRLHTFVWRNWESVPVDTMAKVLETSPKAVREIARSMGLPPQGRISTDFLKRGYVTLIKRNWHLLSYEQLLTLLGWDAERLDETIQHEDFLWIKLGGLKPACEMLHYTAPGDTAKKRCAQIKKWVQDHFADSLNTPREPRFQFIKELSIPDQPVSRHHIVNSEDEQIRFIYSYFAPYGDPLLNPELNPFPDGLLQRLSQVGVNGVWIHVVLNQLSPPSDIFPEFGKGHQRRLENLRQLVRRAKRYGVKIYLYINEPRGEPESFFKGRESLKGVHYTWADNDIYALCTSQPQVRKWICDSLAYVFREVPGLGGVFTITASENITNCWSSFHPESCPRCSRRTAWDVISEVNRTIADGVWQGDPQAKVIVWDWGWEDDWVEPIIQALPDKVYYMTVSEWDLPINRGGVAGKVNEYSLSAVGPSERSIKRWRWAKQRGLKTLAKVQINTTWELSTLPYLSVMHLFGRHCEQLAEADIDGLMLSWSLGGCPSPNLQVAEQFSRKPAPPLDQALLAVAKDRYGEQAAFEVVQAWRQFSTAFAEYPFCQQFIYRGPMQVGPANLLYPEPTGMKSTMVGFPFDDVDHWRGSYPADVLAGQLDKIANGWQGGLDCFKNILAHEMTAEQKDNARRDYRLAEAACLYFKSAANQIRFILTRDVLQSEAPDSPQRSEWIGSIRTMVEDELAIAMRFFTLSGSDSRFGFEASNQYNYLPLDFIEKSLNCDYLLNSWLYQQEIDIVK